MRTWLWMLAMGCTGTSAPVAQTPPPEAQADAALPASTSTVAVPEGPTLVAFSDKGLMLGDELVTPAIDGASGLEPKGITTYGQGIVPLVAKVMRGGVPLRKGESALLSIPGATEYRVAKGIMRTLHMGGFTGIHILVRDPQGHARSIPIHYPLIVGRNEVLPTTVRVLLSPEGLTIDGLGDLARSDRISWTCDPDCSTLKGWPLEQVTRMAARARLQKDIQHVIVVPHNDVKWEVVVATIDAARHDPTPAGGGEEYLIFASIAGSRDPAPTPAERRKIKSGARMMPNPPMLGPEEAKPPAP
ncbi:MAG: hypothetical protein AB8H79_17415 [Myxococcota bacterium]